jgi:transcriptional regulator of heat shock response
MLISIYPKETILGVFYTEIVYKEFEEENLKLYAIYLPSFTDMCKSSFFKKKIKGVHFIDIRLLNIENLPSYYIKVNPMYENLYQEYIANVKDASSDEIKNHFVTFMYAILNHNSVKKEELKKFLEGLSEKEEKAFDFIKNELSDGAGIISISKMVEKTNISRPVYKNLISKMEINKIAEITNMGVKGTKIKIYNPALWR